MMHLTLSAKRRTAWVLILVLVGQLFMPYRSFALTGGPSQPEVQSFEPIGTSEMVDVSSGSFTYNIPLLDVGGYPINLAYHSGSTPDDEATVCGLGWNINPGVVNRNMRGLPDDFSGDVVTKEFNMKPNKTWGGSLGAKFELFGLSKKKGGLSLGLNLGVFYNNYKGVGFEFGVMPGFSAGDKGTLNVGLGLSANSQTGVNVSPSLSYSAKLKDAIGSEGRGNINGGISIGAPINSRQGLAAMTIGTSLGIAANGTHWERNKGGKSYSEKSTSKSRNLFGTSSSYSFATPSYTPSSSLPFSNFSFSGTFSLGLEFIGSHPAGSISGYFSKQELSQKTKAHNAFGYLYAHNGAGGSNNLMDFNREKDGAPFTKHTPNLPMHVFTNDIYGAVGQGISGSYQLKRGDIGVLSDPAVQSNGSGANISGEIGIGMPPGVHGGADIVVNSTDSYSSAWTNDNTAASALKFVAPIPNDPNYEAAYFKVAGEKSVETDPAFSTNNGNRKPVRVDLNAGGWSDMNVEASKGPITQPRRTKRERRNQNITYLTAAEANNMALERKIRSYPANNFSGANTTIVSIGRTFDFRKPHHLSEITLLRQDGLRYVYGIPAYNKKQQELGFSVGNTGICSNGLVAYSNQEASTGNASGLDNYYNKTEIPAYAHSYLLTAIVSQDYVDLTNDGPTPDDYGTYTKFNYSRLAFNGDSTYNWRVPYENNMANFNEGFKSDKYDNKGNYLYGEKEYWVLHSIESKTQVAEFNYDLTGRTDAKSALTNKMLPKLTNINLFALSERRPNNVFNINALPIKSVWFEYDQSLCKGIPNGGGQGKLTLKKLWFTYGSSQKGKISPYKFKYQGSYTGNEFDYGLKNYNRWGSFQNNKGLNNTDCYDNIGSPTLSLNTSDFPYVPQVPADADKNAYAYNLTEIALPSGGVIKVEYEANRYAYTQDRRAMEMVEVFGAGNSTSLPSSDIDKLYSGTNPNNFIFFKLRTPISGIKFPTDQAAKKELYRQYLQGAEGKGDITDGFLYFKFLIDVGISGQKKYEFVPGYVPLKDYGVFRSLGSSDYTYGYIQLNKVNTNDNDPNPDANPIARTAWQFTRLYLPDIAYGGTNVNESSGNEQIIRALASMGDQMKQFVTGFNAHMRNNNYGQKFIPSKSWIRLYSPEKNKIAGGSRVKSIRIADNWDKMDAVSGSNFEYGQDYDYTTFEVVNGDTLQYSSGVAAYEPMAGGDENPFRQPIFFTEKVLLAPDNRYYQEAPLCESYFPSPQIVYSKVTVRNKQHTGVNRAATGSVVQEFYTAKDFPTVTSATPLKAVPKKTKAVFRQLKLKHKDFMTASQGFAIELNDMHGKPKAQWVYDQSGTRLSGVEYFYKSAGNRLVNENIPVVNGCGVIENKIVGLESSLAADSRESYTKTGTFGVQLNSDNFLAGFFPVMTVIPLPSYHQEETRFRSMATTKVIQRYGLLEKTVAYDLGASVSTENIAWDAETGEVLITKTSNEFKDPIYNTNIPAHWAYEGMRGAWQNIGAIFQGKTTTAGKITETSLHTFFTPGDEVSVNNSRKVWVKDVNRTSGEVYFIEENGTQASFSGATLKIIRSGRRNQQLSSIGSVTSTKLPINAANNTLDFTAKGILNASAVEYGDRWQTWCNLVKQENCTCTSTPIGRELLAFLNLLIQAGKFNNDAANKVNLNSTLSGFSGSLLDAAIRNKLGQACAAQKPVLFWTEKNQPHPNTGVPTHTVIHLAIDGCGECTININTYSVNLINAKFVKFLDIITGETEKDCTNDDFHVVAQVTIPPADQIQTVQLFGECFCLDFLTCNQASNGFAICGNQVGQTVNPYRTNNRGVYRPLRNWTYLNDRLQSNPANIRTDGTFAAFTNFWTRPSAGCKPDNPNTWASAPTNWIWVNEVTRYNPVGNELENRDTLNRYSAELVGYRNTQVVANAANARYRQIAFDGFEDYFFNLSSPQGACQAQRHISFDPALVDKVSGTAHSGKYALKLSANTATEAKNEIKLPKCPTPLAAKTPNVPFALDDCDCVGQFSPDPGKYVFSAWIREDRSPGALKFDQASIEIAFGNSAPVAIFKAAGPVIEGWQRVYGEFDVPLSAADIRIRLKAAPGFNSWFDDIRIHPFDARFKSFVYDDVNLRFTYELDENNFFTRYEYDQQGMLERIKKETERGVMTIQESRFGQQKTQ